MTRNQLEQNLGREVKIRLFHEKKELTGRLRKTGDIEFKNNPNLYLPYNYYFLTNVDSNICITPLFRVSHIQNLKVLR